MKNREALQERFLREPLSNRLGELAVSLAQIKSHADQNDRDRITAHFIEESCCLAEWIIPEAEAGLRNDLIEIHRHLSEWRSRWEDIQTDEQLKQTVITQAGQWSDQMLNASGLLQPPQMRLDDLAPSLARIEALLSDKADANVAAHRLLSECMGFIKRAAPEMKPDLQAELSELQRTLARWSLNWAAVQTDATERKALAEQAGEWSKRMQSGAEHLQSAQEAT